MKKLEPDFIKWLCEKAGEGWEFDNDKYHGPIVLIPKAFFLVEDFVKGKHYFPLLLSRAIDGVNSSVSLWKVSQHDHGIYTHRPGNTAGRIKLFRYTVDRSYDDARLAALEWIWEKECEK